MPYHRVCNQSNTTGATNGSVTAYPSVVPEFILGFRWDSCCSIFCSLCSICISFFLSFRLFSFGHRVVYTSLIYDMVSSNYIVFLNNTACLVQDQSIENVTKQKYVLPLPVLFSNDFKEDGGKFTTTSELLSEFMIINFNFMKVHVYLSQ